MAKRKTQDITTSANYIYNTNSVALQDSYFAKRLFRHCMMKIKYEIICGRETIPKCEQFLKSPTHI